MQSLLGTKPKKTSIIHVPKQVENAFGAFDRSKAELEAFRQRNAKVIERYDELRAEVVTCEENAKAAYEKHKDTLGPSFNGYVVRKRRSIDALELVSRHPELMEFVELSITVPVYEELLAANAISQETARLVERTTENIAKAPK
jgi:hypothetical protein